MHVASLHDRDKSGRLLPRELLVANRRLRAGFLCNIDNRKAQIVHSAVVRRLPDDPGRARRFLRDEFIHIIGDAMEFLRPNDKIDMRQIL